MNVNLNKLSENINIWCLHIMEQWLKFSKVNWVNKCDEKIVKLHSIVKNDLQSEEKKKFFTVEIFCMKTLQWSKNKFQEVFNFTHAEKEILKWKKKLFAQLK